MKRILVPAVIAMTATTAAAQDSVAAPTPDAAQPMLMDTLDASAMATPDISVALGFSTLGANLEAGVRLSPTYGVRGALIGGIDVDYEESDEDGEFSGNVTLGGIALLGDFYPMESDWRISGGLFLSNSELSATGTTDAGLLTDVEATVEAAFKSDISPMITTGYDLSLGSGWSLNSEVGVIFTGGIDITYTASDPTLQDELDNDPDLQEVIDDAADIIIYPYVGLTVSYQF